MVGFFCCLIYWQFQWGMRCFLCSRKKLVCLIIRRKWTENWGSNLTCSLYRIKQWSRWRETSVQILFMEHFRQWITPLSVDNCEQMMFTWVCEASWKPGEDKLSLVDVHLGLVCVSLLVQPLWDTESFLISPCSVCKQWWLLNCSEAARLCKHVNPLIF